MATVTQLKKNLLTYMQMIIAQNKNFFSNKSQQMVLKQLGSHLQIKVGFLFHIPSKNKFQVDQRFIFMKLSNKNH